MYKHFFKVIKFKTMTDERDSEGNTFLSIRPSSIAVMRFAPVSAAGHSAMVAVRSRREISL